MTLIVLDGGHGGKDPGAGAFGLAEKDVTLELAKKTEIFLKRDFICDVLLTRRQDAFVSLDARTDYSNNQKADFFYSFHVNSAAPDAEGFETFIHDKLSNRTKTAQIQKVIHGYIVQEVIKKYDIKDRGAKKANFHVLRETKCPAVLTEHLFISNMRENDLLKDDSFLTEFARATATGIGMALSLKRKKDDDLPPPPKEKPKPPKNPDLFVLRVGAFKEENNAKNRIIELKNAGFRDAYIKRDSGLYVIQAGAYRDINNAKARLMALKNKGFKDSFIKTE